MISIPGCPILLEETELQKVAILATYETTSSSAFPTSRGCGYLRMRILSDLLHATATELEHDPISKATVLVRTPQRPISGFVTHLACSRKDLENPPVVAIRRSSAQVSDPSNGNGLLAMKSSKSDSDNGRDCVVVLGVIHSPHHRFF